MAPSALVWLRRDLRCDDHAALYHALHRYARVYCAFVFDTDILDALPTRCDRRVEFIHASVLALHQGLQQLAAGSGAAGGGLIVRHGPAVPCILQLAQELGVQEVLANRDDEPGAVERDRQVAQRLQGVGIAFHLAGQLGEHLAVLGRIGPEALNAGLRAAQLRRGHHVHGLGDLLGLADPHDLHFYVFE